MIEDFAELVRRSREWFERAAAAGWFAAGDRRRFEAVERATPADLFESAPARPLGGGLVRRTGVGKSSLLNRIADAPIAVVGPNGRPRAKQACMYTRRSSWPICRPSCRSPRANPPPQVRRQRDVLWIDAPTSTASRRKTGKPR